MNDWSMLKKLIWLHIVKGGGGIERTVKGAIVHVTNALARPAISVKCEVNPIQDLHGYGNPWPAGGGKNKMPPPTSISQPIHGTATDNNGKISISTDGNSATFEVYIPPFTFAESGQKIEMLNSFTGATIYFFNGTTQVDYFSMSTQNRVINSASMTALLGKTIDRYRLTINAQSLTGGTFGLMVTPESDPALTTFSPYSNICPISGRTSATVTRTGKNLANPKLYTGGAYNATIGSTWNLVESSVQLSDIGNGQFSIDLGSWAFRVFIFDLLEGQSYRFNCGFSGEDVATSHGYLDENYKVLSKYNETGSNIQKTVTFTGTSERRKAYVGFAPRSSAQTVMLTELQLELGSTASAYEPYQSNTYTIQLGDTVYGGTLDVTAGKMVVDRANIASYNGEPLPGEWISDRDVYSTGGTPTIGAQVVYFLATPIEITLTPTQIDMLLGENNLWADAGDLTLTYYADGNASTSEALGILLGGTYNNPGGADDVSDDEALEILLGGS